MDIIPIYNLGSQTLYFRNFIKRFGTELVDNTGRVGWLASPAVAHLQYGTVSVHASPNWAFWLLARKNKMAMNHESFSDSSICIFVNFLSA